MKKPPRQTYAHKKKATTMKLDLFLFLFKDIAPLPPPFTSFFFFLKWCEGGGGRNVFGWGKKVRVLPLPYTRDPVLQLYYIFFYLNNTSLESCTLSSSVAWNFHSSQSLKQHFLKWLLILDLSKFPSLRISIIFFFFSLTQLHVSPYFSTYQWRH